VDNEEPARIAEAVARLKLSHVVITSPTRDDLPDGGASHYCAAVESIRSTSPATRIELLIPDFLGSRESVVCVLGSQPDVVAHNVETVPRLYRIRSGAIYMRSLEVLRTCAEFAPDSRTKSGLMLGMGEQPDEVIGVMQDLYAVGCRYLSIGQYLAPSRDHYPVQEYIYPEVFEKLADSARQMGFLHVESGPYVRSSYHAGQYR
jgi:lipoic acid synthetase